MLSERIELYYLPTKAKLPTYLPTTYYLLPTTDYLLPTTYLPILLTSLTRHIVTPTTITIQTTPIPIWLPITKPSNPPMTPDSLRARVYTLIRLDSYLLFAMPRVIPNACLVRESNSTTYLPRLSYLPTYYLLPTTNSTTYSISKVNSTRSFAVV